MKMPSPAQQKSLESEVAAAQRALPNSPAQTFCRSRGLTDDTVDRFRFGYDPQGNRLVIPYLHPAGIWHVKRRCLSHQDCKAAGHDAKYSYSPGIEMHLFNAQTLLTADAVVVTEGELDAVACEQAGIPTVGYPGTSTWSKMRHWPLCFDSAEEVVVIADGDEPGAKAAGVVAKSLREKVSADVRVVQMPAGEDASSFLAGHGASEFLYLIDWL